MQSAIKEGNIEAKYVKTRKSLFRSKNEKYRKYLAVLETNDGNACLKLNDISRKSASKKLKLSDVTIERCIDRPYCIVISVERMQGHLYLSSNNETDLHEWISALISLRQPEIKLVTTGQTNQVFVISFDGDKTLIGDKDIQTWMTIDHDSIRLYDMFCTKVILSIDSDQFISSTLVDQCSTIDCGKIFELTFRYQTQQKWTIGTLKLFSLNADNIFRQLTSTLSTTQNRDILEDQQHYLSNSPCHQQSNMKFLDSPKTQMFKKSNKSKSVDNLSSANSRTLKKGFWCFVSDDHSPSTSPSGSLKSVDSATAPKQQAPQLPSKEELEKRENVKLMLKDSFARSSDPNGYVTNWHHSSTNLHNGTIYCPPSPLGSTVPAVPPLPPRASTTPQRSESKIHEESFYKILSISSRPNSLESNGYKLLPTTKSDLHLDLDPPATILSINPNYKTLSALSTPAAEAATTPTYRGYNVLTFLHGRSVRISTETQV